MGVPTALEREVQAALDAYVKEAAVLRDLSLVTEKNDPHLRRVSIQQARVRRAGKGHRAAREKYLREALIRFQ